MTVTTVINTGELQTLVMKQKMLPVISATSLQNPDNVGNNSQLT